VLPLGKGVGDVASLTISRVRIHQVLRDSKIRVASLGSAVGPAELDQWQRQITAFFTAGSGRCVHSGKPAKREKFNVPRLASYDWVVAIDNSLRQATGKGFERFAGADQIYGEWQGSTNSGACHGSVPASVDSPAFSATWATSALLPWHLL
jgi:hypothetical protein